MLNFFFPPLPPLLRLPPAWDFPDNSGLSYHASFSRHNEGTQSPILHTLLGEWESMHHRWSLWGGVSHCLHTWCGGAPYLSLYLDVISVSGAQTCNSLPVNKSLFNPRIDSFLFFPLCSIVLIWQTPTFYLPVFSVTIKKLFCFFWVSV